ncbi:MAG: c(7)-type cytochrome triheme domain-containing protein [Thermodesulfobacteriota bacterium]
MGDLLKRGFICLLLTFIVIVPVTSAGGAEVSLEKELRSDYIGIKSPGAYGTVLMDRYTGEGKAMKSVVFPHWAHRTKFTCKVCHNDMGFPMKAGASDIKMADINAGKSCGQCHNGTDAFGATSCNRCHSLGMDVPENGTIEEALKDLPRDGFGNHVDWVKALRERKIEPKATLDGTEEMWVFDKDIPLPVTKFSPHPPDVVYPHKGHTEWLHCGSCHPSVFNMKAGGNPEMSMRKIYGGQYCGVCHGKVAFPLENCFRCHSHAPQKPPYPDTEDGVEKGKK